MSRESKNERNPTTNRKSKPKQINYSDLNDALNEIGLYCKDVLGDGNCLFRALSDQQFGHPNEHAEIRHNICEFINDNGDDFSPFIDSGMSFERYIENMRKSGTFGGNMELVAFSRYYKADIKVYQADTPIFVIRYESEHPVENNKVMHVGYHDYEHYSSVRNISGPHEGPPEIKEAYQIIDKTKKNESPEATYKLEKKLDSKIKSVMHSTGLTNKKTVLELLKKYNGSMDKVIDDIYSNDNYFSFDDETLVAEGVDKEFPLSRVNRNKDLDSKMDKKTEQSPIYSNIQVKGKGRKKYLKPTDTGNSASSKPVKPNRLSATEKKRTSKLKQKEQAKAKKLASSSKAGSKLESDVSGNIGKMEQLQI